jgi:hypothetical protein
MKLYAIADKSADNLKNVRGIKVRGVRFKFPFKFSVFAFCLLLSN